MQACEEYGIGFIPYFSIAAGSVSRIEAIQEVCDAADPRHCKLRTSQRERRCLLHFALE
ncbi:hypothetical protein [Halohasta litorea]|uniref:Uncharacterized protein n=1 Tax=Halohasta litorea TaxID=869891 RepID=A0ABD6DBZ2_9EURY